MAGETNLETMIRNLSPKLHEGEFVFCCVPDASNIDREEIICELKENEGITLVIERQKADELNLNYTFVSSWITLMVYSSLEAVGLTAIFSAELAKNKISCNVIAGFHHDHIFVDVRDVGKAMIVLSRLSESYK